MAMARAMAPTRAIALARAAESRALLVDYAREANRVLYEVK